MNKNINIENFYPLIMIHKEHQYINLIKECIEQEEYQNDRTGTGTRSIFGKSMRFSLKENSFPLLTSKFVPFRVVAEELLFFIRGQTDNIILKSKNIYLTV